MLSMDGSGNEEDDDVKQLAKFKKQLGYSFESASRISEMTTGSALLSINLPPCCSNESGGSQGSSPFQ